MSCQLTRNLNFSKTGFTRLQADFYLCYHLSCLELEKTPSAQHLLAAWVFCFYCVHSFILFCHSWAPFSFCYKFCSIFFSFGAATNVVPFQLVLFVYASWPHTFIHFALSFWNFLCRNMLTMCVDVDALCVLSVCSVYLYLHRLQI